MHRLEHANICVTNIDSMIKFIQTAFPEFKERGGGVSSKGTKWLHIGTDDTYLALQLADEESDSKWIPYSGKPGVNHLAFEVDDVDSLRERMLSAGYKESTPPNAHPYRKRIYFYDSEGNDWEFVQYYTDKYSERNDYELPDL
jgi:catechol 2,3-dioxygenase-like lactoylglutathione lyase family enzyme